MSDVLDLRTGELKTLYAVKAKEPVFLRVPELTVIEVAGQGDPNTSAAFANAVQALMGVAWGARMARKGTDKPVFKVMPLEGEWEMPPGVDFEYTPDVMDRMLWRMQLVMPDDFDDAECESARNAALRRHPDVEALNTLRLTSLPAHEACALLHIGPFADEPTSFARMHEAIDAAGMSAELGHREIYLSDFRRTAPEKLKTILRLRTKPITS